MSITLNNVVTNLNTYLGDSSTDRVSDAERYQYLTEATSWLSEELGNEHMLQTWVLNYLDGVYYYKVTSAVGDLLVGADLRRGEKDQNISATRKSPRELSEEIGQNSREFCWAIDRHDGDTYIGVTLNGKNKKQVVANFDTLTSDGGTWTADTTGSDALNVTYDTNEKEEGSASLNFDVDVSQSGNNLATVYIALESTKDLSDLEELGSFTARVYIPDVTYVTSYRLRFSSDTSGTPSTITNYWSITSTTDINGNALVNGWNRVKFDWNGATMTGTPDSSEIAYFQIDVNYSSSQTDDTDFRLDDLAIVKPEKLTFHYVSWNVGTNNSGTSISAFTALTDVPFYSGLYDQYKYAVAHKAASLIFYGTLRQKDQGLIEEGEAIKALDRYRKRFESSMTREEKSFKIKGVNFRNRRARNYRR